ncbi:MAG TPA: hypothetical protein VNO26_05765 [Candidatus Limnocylindria bacterium]|nr:hypothetical protein [Candidatus Limnocylindria bacterium]
MPFNMNKMAKVSVDTGVVFLTVETPYDCDLLFEYLQSIARSHRQVDIELERLRVSVSDGVTRGVRCAGCGRALAPGVVRFLIAERELCGRCARDYVRDADGEAPAVR